MKKSIVALFVGLAVIVLVSPAIVGRLAEKSMDANLEWAADETDEFLVTSQGFDRGWFSSAGQHRVEVRDGQLRDLLTAFQDEDDLGTLPALIIDTRLDHGLIAVTSMSRAGGTLVPGLGSAVSTLSIETADGQRIALPGVINSTVGLTGELNSTYVLASGSTGSTGDESRWGAVDISVTSNPTNGSARYAGVIESFAIANNDDVLQIDGVEFSGKQKQTGYGFAVGTLTAAVNSASVLDLTGEVATLGPLTIDVSSTIDKDRVSGRTTFRLDGVRSPEFGRMEFAADIRFSGLDAAPLGRLKQALEDLPDDADAGEVLMYAQEDAERLFASGFAVHIDQLDLVMPQGPVTSSFNFVVDPSDADSFTWLSILLALNASAQISAPEELIDLTAMINPDVNAVIAMGFLKKNGDVYEMEAAFKKGLLTINGAPMPIPLPGTY